MCDAIVLTSVKYQTMSHCWELQRKTLHDGPVLPSPRSPALQQPKTGTNRALNVIEKFAVPDGS